MAVITIAEVKEFISTSLPDAAIQLMIDLSDDADACLTALEATTTQATIAKIYGVAAMIQEQSGGAIASQSSFTGDSVTFAGKDGVLTNTWLKALQGMTGGQCVLSAIGYGGTFPATLKRG